MLRHVSIQNYRVFSHFELDDLALVNLVVGMNNSGKSSLLEAIYLLTSDDPTDTLFHILEERGEVVNGIATDKLRRNGSYFKLRIFFMVMFYNQASRSRLVEDARRGQWAVGYTRRKRSLWLMSPMGVYKSLRAKGQEP